MSSHRRAVALALAGLLAFPALAAAREAHHAKPAAKPQSRAAIAASEGFTARMSRLDALMGGPRTLAPRARSASAAVN
ncbi:hypothetical protein [Methylobacterium radiodurans]|uniref:Uncharacterized protein n=1 Tax=Methylobacterium radiodurans TaxID=2202828 RepID=A0A2U8VSU6_9HYPH|nr:hypothetical protein [Methylobacterium radiodurans]AWN36508.1 hypothetical protein DK427_12860 [Methylobacterium radiodurans]